jgi:hypothetical protein
VLFAGVDPEVDWSGELVVGITVLLANIIFDLKYLLSINLFLN